MVSKTPERNIFDLLSEVYNLVFAWLLEKDTAWRYLTLGLIYIVLIPVIPFILIGRWAEKEKYTG